MMTQERRRDRRFPISFSGILRRGTILAVTEDVSYRGMLLCADGPIPLGQLHVLELFVTGDVLVRLHLVAVRIFTEAPRWRVGVRLIGTEPRWESAVAELQAAHKEVPARPAGIGLPAVPVVGASMRRFGNERVPLIAAPMEACEQE